MIISKDNNGKPIGFIETLISNERVVTVNATRQATTITTRDRANGKVKSETFYGTLPLIPKDRCAVGFISLLARRLSVFATNPATRIARSISGK